MTLITAEQYGTLTGKTLAEIDVDIAAGAVEAVRVGWQVLVAEPDAEQPAKAASNKRTKKLTPPLDSVPDGGG